MIVSLITFDNQSNFYWYGNQNFNDQTMTVGKYKIRSGFGVWFEKLVYSIDNDDIGSKSSHWIWLLDKYRPCKFTSDEIQSGTSVMSLLSMSSLCRFTSNEIASGMIFKFLWDKSIYVVVAIS